FLRSPSPALSSPHLLTLSLSRSHSPFYAYVHHLTLSHSCSPFYAYVHPLMLTLTFLCLHPPSRAHTYLLMLTPPLSRSYAHTHPLMLTFIISRSHTHAHPLTLMLTFLRIPST